MIHTHPHRAPASPIRHRGNVLVLVIVVLGLLALLGGAYLQTARVQRQMFFDTEDCTLLARSFVIDDIKARLKDDIFNPDTGVFFDVTAGTEPYDRAWTNETATYDVFDVSGNDIGDARGNEDDDTWLASALPFLDGTTWRWRQITTLNGAWFPTNAATDVADRRLADNVSGGDNPVDWYGNGTTLRNTIDYNISAFGDPSLVDADADGVPDSRLERVSSFATKNGVEYYAAVRIIDLASFLNINTALSSVDASGNSVGLSDENDSPRGNNPSELNLGNVVLGLTGTNQAAFSAETLSFNNWRGANGTDYANDREPFWRRVGRRLGNPVNSSTSNVLSDLDEAQLRFRGGAYNLDDHNDAITDATNGIESVLGQGTGDTAFGADGINTVAEANRFFPYAPLNTTSTRIRFTASSGEAMFGVPTPRESADFPNQRVLRTPLNNAAYGLSFNYPLPDPAITPDPLERTLGNDEAFDSDQDSVTTPVNRPGQRIQDNTEALTELAFDIKTIFNNAFTTSKAVTGAEPQAGSASLTPATPGNNEAPVLFGDVVATNEADVNLFAVQFAANFEDYVDADNVLTVLDIDGLPTADRDADDTRVFPLDNTWTDTSMLDGTLPADTGPESIRYGFELLPYITEVYIQADYEIAIGGVTGPVIPDMGSGDPDYTVTWETSNSPGPDAVGYAIEIRNPFNTPISLNNVHLYVGRTPATAGNLLPDTDEWTTTTTGVTAARDDADYDGDDLPAAGVTDYDLADLVTNQLRLSGAIAADQNKTELDPNEVLILYRNANGGTDNDQIVDAGKFANASGSTAGPGLREAGSRQWDASVAANSIPTDSAIDDRDTEQRYTYVQLPIDWPTTAEAITIGDYDPGQVTVELRIAVANEVNGFDTNVMGGDENTSPTAVPRLERLRYQVVDSAIAPVDRFFNTHLDLLSAPVEGSRVTMQYSTVGNANGVNAMLMRRGDFENRMVFPDQFQNALTGSNFNDELADLIAPTPGGNVETVSRVDVYEQFATSTTPGETVQLLLGNNNKTSGTMPAPVTALDGYSASTTGGSNANIGTVADEQVLMRNGPIELDAEITHLLLLGIEPLNPTSPLLSGSTADSFFDSTLRPDGTPDPTSLNHYRLNLGLNPSIPLPTTNDVLNDDNVHWDKPHARYLLERVTVLSPARDGVDNDGDGLTDGDDADEQFVAGRLNLNNAERDLIAAAIPFGNAAVRDDVADAIEALRGDTTTVGPAALGTAQAWDVIDQTTSPATPTLQNGGDDQSVGGTRIDFLQNEIASEDGVDNDVEEFFLLAGNAQQVLTTRSDVYVAYILVQGYRDANGNGDFADGPEDGLIEQSRSIVIFDRSKLVNGSDDVESRVLFEFPQ